MIDKEKLILKLDKWHKTLLDMGDFGVIQNYTTVFHMNTEKFFALEGLDESELSISNRSDSDFPYEVNLKVGNYQLFTILTVEEYAKYFPEKVEKQDDFILIDGVKYRKEV